MAHQKNVRPAVLAGRWYEGDANALHENIKNWLKSPDFNEKPQAIIVPHAGHVWSGDVAGSGWGALQGHTYKRIFILCPNHRLPVDGIAADPSDAFDTPLGAIDIDTETRDALLFSGLVRMNQSAHKAEHAIEIQLPFMKMVAPDAKLVPLIVGHLSDRLAQKFAAKLREIMTSDDLIVVSSDFVHYGENYGFVPFKTNIAENIKRFDEQTIQAISWIDGDRFADFARENDHSACGINALRVLAYTFEQTDALVKRLAYDTSGRKTSSFDSSVSYVSLAILNSDMNKIHEGSKSIVEKSDKTNSPVMVLDELAQAKANALIRLAVRQAVEAGHETTFEPSEITKQIGPFPKVFEKQFGVFVTLHKNGNLRGCIGNILPYQNLMLALWGRAQDAALNDPRFNSVTPDELPSITYEISVLTPPEPISGPEDIVIGRHGVILKKMGRQAVFLPQVAPEQGWNVEQMLTALSLKAGLRRDDWRENAEFSVIEAQVF